MSGFASSYSHADRYLPSIKAVGLYSKNNIC